jgi:hypothetical protein
MTALLNYLPYISLIIGSWMVLNGVLHDFFILRSEHGKRYDRELLRLLMDAHILITCGIMQIISYSGLQNREPWAYYVSGASCISLLVYCAMIFPFLKSIGTILLNGILLGMLLFDYFLYKA